MVMVDNNISDTILQTEVLPMATETNAIPGKDSFLLPPKRNESAPTDSGNKDESLVTAANDHKISNKGQLRRSSTGNIALPYTKVKVLSRYLESSSIGSCHDYCKYGARREGEEATPHDDQYSSTFMKRVNDALGKGHQMFKHTATLMERRKKRSIHVTPTTTKTASLSLDSPKADHSPLSIHLTPITKTASLSLDNPKTDHSPLPSNNRRSARTNSKVVHNSPRRPDSDVASKHHAGGGGVGLRLNSSSASEIAVVGSPIKLESKRDDGTPTLVRSRTTLSKQLSGSELGLVATSPPPRYEKHRRSKSVSKVEISSSYSYSPPSVDKLPILSKIYSSSPTIVSEIDGVSSALTNPKFQRFEAFISPLIHRRGHSMPKLPLSSSPLKEVDGSSKKSLLPRSLSANKDRKYHRSSKSLEEALVSSSPIEGLRKSRSISIRTEQKGSGTVHDHEKKLVEKGTVASPARHTFLRRQPISGPLRSSWKNLTPRINGDKSENRNTILSPLKEDHHQHPNNLKKHEAEETKDEKGSSDEKAPHTTELIKSSSSIVSQAKHEATSKSSNKSSSSSERKRFIKRAQNNVRQSPLFHEKYKILRRTGARSVVSEPMVGPSDDCLSVMSSTDSCETDHVLEQKAMERVLASRINAHFSRGTRRRASMNIGGYQDAPARKLKFRPGRVIEFKSEINSPCRRLKFKRRTTPRSGIGSPKSNVGMIFGVLRKAGGGRRESTNNRVQFADVNAAAAEKVVLRHQEMQQEKGSQLASLNNVIEETASKLAEDRKSKVKALVGAFESLLTLQDSKPTSPTVTA